MSSGYYLSDISRGVDSLDVTNRYLLRELRMLNANQKNNLAMQIVIGSSIVSFLIYQNLDFNKIEESSIEKEDKKEVHGEKELLQEAAKVQWKRFKKDVKTAAKYLLVASPFIAVCIVIKSNR